jgi:hypothetical protein
MLNDNHNIDRKSARAHTKGVPPMEKKDPMKNRRNCTNGLPNKRNIG